MLGVLDDVLGAHDTEEFRERLQRALSKHFGWAGTATLRCDRTGSSANGEETANLAIGARQQAIMELLGRHLAPLARDLADASRAVRPPLTPREAQVTELVAAGLSNGQIADLMDISVSTVKKHVTRVLTKSGCTSRMELAVLWLRLNGEGSGTGATG
ncbi:response regulator transcription factor [Actinomadura rudentiformis]|nr:LuxR C-terminal-related transcriptional regulator [Actinomadura rudentiformis]